MIGKLIKHILLFIHCVIFDLWVLLKMPKGWNFVFKKINSLRRKYDVNYDG